MGQAENQCLWVRVGKVYEAGSRGGMVEVQR